MCKFAEIQLLQLKLLKKHYFNLSRVNILHLQTSTVHTGRKQKNHNLRHSWETLAHVHNDVYY